LMNGVNGNGGFQNFQALNGANASPAVTLYSTAPPPANPPSTSQLTPSTPQNAPSSASNSPRKQHKTVPQSTGSALTSAPSTSSGPSIVTAAPTNTPSMSNSSLKRKQSDTASPTGPDQAPPAKRTTRKRGRGAGG